MAMKLPLLRYLRFFVGAMLLLGSACSLFACVVGSFQSAISYSGGERVEGKVVGLDAYRARKGGRGARPIVEYRVGDVRHRITGLGSSPPAYEIGDRVEVHVPTDHPDRAKIDSFAERAVMFAPYGVLAIVLGFWGIFTLGLPEGPKTELSLKTTLIALLWFAIFAGSILGLRWAHAENDSVYWQIDEPYFWVHVLMNLALGASIGGLIGFLNGRYVSAPLIGLGLLLFLTFLWTLSYGVSQALS